jgi:hypothetical protein
MATRLPKVTVTRQERGGYVVDCSACEFRETGTGRTTTRYDADRVALQHRQSHQTPLREHEVD